MKALNLKQLPIHSKLERYEQQAKDLIRAFRTRHPQAICRITQFHPRLRGRFGTNDRNKVTEAQIRKTGVTLADSRSVVARWHGFESWSGLAEHVEAATRKDSPVRLFETAVE